MNLPIAYQEQYQTFSKAIAEISEKLNSEGIDAADLKISIAQLQHQFQTQILTLESNDLDAASAQQVYSFNVEIDKQLRLLNTDLMFLQVARQTNTIAQRIQHIRDRITRLTLYCNALLEEKDAED